MIQFDKFDNLKEKELLIAHYFCEKSRKEPTSHEIFDMWSNWFKNDFRVNGKSVFVVVDDELVYRKSVKSSDVNILKRYNHTFQNIYKYIKRTLEIDGHNKAFFRQELDKERNREYGRVISIAKPLDIYVSMNARYNKLADFRLSVYKKKGQTITCGDCDKMIKYLNKVKKDAKRRSNINEKSIIH